MAVATWRRHPCLGGRESSRPLLRPTPSLPMSRGTAGRSACASLPSRLILDNQVGQAIVPASRLSAGRARWKAGPQPERLHHIAKREIVKYYTGHHTRSRIILWR
jgi:hypothetical protein